MALQHFINYNPTDLLFLCGAGISYNPPTNLPTVNSFVLEILRECDAEAKVIRTVKKKIITGQIVARFEVLVDEIRKLHDPFLKIGRIFNSNSYNKLHCFLGQMLLRGASILTTNFDNCIENSIGGQAIPRIVFNGKDLTYSPSPYGTLVKIHGSNPLPSGDKSSQLIITIKALATTVQGFAKFPNWRSYLHRLLRDKIIIVLGYSGSDEFDINPVLLESRPRRVLWIDFNHSPRLPIQVRHINNPRIKSLAANLPLSYYQGHIEQQIEDWARLLSIPLHHSKVRLKHWSIKKYITTLYPAISHKEELVNEILLGYALYELVVRRKTRSISAGIILQRIKALYRLGKTKESCLLFEKHRKQFKRAPQRLQALYFQSASLYQLGRLSEAIDIAERQLSLAKRGKDSVAIIHALNNLGGIYFAAGQLTKARACYKQSLREQHAGNSIEGQATAFWGLADIASVKGHYAEAYDLYLRARQTYIELGHSYSLTWTDLNIGVALTGLQRYSAAEIYLRRAEKAFRAPLNLTGLLFVLNALGKLYYRRRWLRRAITVISEGFVIIQQNPNLPVAVEIALLFICLQPRNGLKALNEKYKSLFEQVAARREDRNSRLLRRFLRNPLSSSVLIHIEKQILR